MKSNKIGYRVGDVFEMPPGMPVVNQLCVYVLNDALRIFYVDDFKITFEE
jgi:hypothetical protein